MAIVSKNDIIKDSADEVWKTIRDFGGMAKYLGTIDECSMEGEGPGAIRTLTLRGGETVVDRLDSLDDAGRIMTYTTLESSVPTDRFTATVEVREEGEGECHVQWNCTYNPDLYTEEENGIVMRGLLSFCFKGLKRLHEGAV